MRLNIIQSSLVAVHSTKSSYQLDCGRRGQLFTLIGYAQSKRHVGIDHTVSGNDIFSRVENIQSLSIEMMFCFLSYLNTSFQDKSVEKLACWAGHKKTLCLQLSGSFTSVLVIDSSYRFVWHPVLSYQLSRGSWTGIIEINGGKETDRKRRNCFC